MGIIENLKKNEKVVLDAVRILLHNIDDIEIFNKKAVYLYLREITGLNTKQVVNNLNKLREKYRNFKTKTQGLIDFWLYLLFYFPGLLVFLYMTIGFVEESIRRGERGMDTTWMPFMWPIKTCLLVGIIFLLIQGFSELLKSYWAAKKGEWPGEDEKQ